MQYYPQKNNNELYHHGIKGQKWGIRRYQNEDGTLTDAGIRRYKGVSGTPSKGQSARIKEHATKESDIMNEYTNKKKTLNKILLGSIAVTSGAMAVNPYLGMTVGAITTAYTFPKNIIDSRNAFMKLVDLDMKYSDITGAGKK